MVAVATASLSNCGASAQVNDAEVRALNLARDWAVNNNGGLSDYRPADCMFNTSNGGGYCQVKTDKEGYTFRLMGGTPGWQQEGLAPTTETEVTVSPDGRTITNIIYNGISR